MNKRIKLLDQQAVDYANNVCDANGIYKGKEYLTVVKEKFAELIVRECVAKCEVVANMATITNTSTKATADSCAIMIKQHFGVEQ